MGAWLGKNLFVSSACGATAADAKASDYTVSVAGKTLSVAKINVFAGSQSSVIVLYHTNESPSVSPTLSPITLASADPADELDSLTAVALGNTCDNCVRA